MLMVQILSFYACNDLSVRNVRITNSPGAHGTINGCNRAKISNLDVQSPSHSPNTDGFDISSSKNILIEDSTIRTGDDCIAINGGSSYISVSRFRAVKTGGSALTGFRLYRAGTKSPVRKRA
ncbi:putative polygalacturonase [Medicago truncatula]|uniref:Putative polygalacturonase n=1 Tax=Medicago truncatula TaxID=3880 RepID=A0A396GM42_MEDTR|nr:putative polygalacturonase [Medicago truncatula]